MTDENSDASETRRRTKTLGTTKISQGGRISLIQDVRDVFADWGVEIDEGDQVVFAIRDGHVVVKPNEVPPDW